MFRPTVCLSLALSLFAAFEASAHLSYSNRTFSILTGVDIQSQTITGQTAKNFGWADGTNEDFARQDDQKYFRITLAIATEVTISITSLDATKLLPAFSLYSGVGHQATGGDLDFDSALTTQAYLTSLGGVTKEGAFDALHSWKIGNDTVPDLISFGYIGNKADGTSANYGSAAGIDGDGVADGTVTKTFSLPAGEYTVVVGGAQYDPQTDATPYGFNMTVSAVPEPSTALLLTGGLAMAGAIRRRRPLAVA